MEGYLSPSGVALIAPALWLIAGFAAATALHFISISLGRRDDLVYLAFGVVCLVIFFNALFLAQTIRAATPEEAIAHHRNRISATIVFFATFAWFVAVYTRHPRPTPWLIGNSLVLGALLTVNVLSPHTIGLAEAIVTTVQLPWGEAITRVQGPLLPWAPFGFLPAYFIVLWACWRSIRQFRDGERTAALALGGFLALLLAALVWRQIMSIRNIGAIPLVDFAFLALAMIMSTRLALVLRDRAMSTEATVEQLRAEMQRRTDAESRLQHLAYHDFLTGLPNRMALVERLHETLLTNKRLGERGAILLLDLDHFKIINDALGHNVGDELLCSIGTRLRQEVRPEDLAVRMGGDEFAILISGLSDDLEWATAQARQVGEQLKYRLTAPFRIGARELRIGVSIGVFVFKDDIAREAEMVSKADLALYSAKLAGRNMVRLFTHSLQADVDERLIMEKELRQAVANNQFSLHFQPQISRVGELIGVEALLRWRRADHDEILPARFIPLAEETGLIHPIGDWVLDTACARLNAWRDNGHELGVRLSVNVSAWQITRIGFAEHVANILARHGTDPRRLILEITESAVLQDADTAVANMKVLLDIGVEFAIDDFGSGYSSLGYLRQLPVQYLKIDRQFVHELQSAGTNGFAELMVTIGKQLGLRVIAEGVETELQQTALASMGCEAFQGYLICAPLPESKFLRWIDGRHRPVFAM